MATATAGPGPATGTHVLFLSQEDVTAEHLLEEAERQARIRTSLENEKFGLKVVALTREQQESDGGMPTKI